MHAALSGVLRDVFNGGEMSFIRPILPFLNVVMALVAVLLFAIDLVALEQRLETPSVTALINDARLDYGAWRSELSPGSDAGQMEFSAQRRK
jgi:hypothetical protein